MKRALRNLVTEKFKAAGGKEASSLYSTARQIDSFHFDDSSASPQIFSSVLEDQQSSQVENQFHRKFVVGANRHYLGSSKYKGVCFNKKKQKWRSRVSFRGKREFLGDWDTELEVSWG